MVVSVFIDSFSVVGSDFGFIFSDCFRFDFGFIFMIVSDSIWVSYSVIVSDSVFGTNMVMVLSDFVF